MRAHAWLPIQEPGLLVLQPLIARKHRAHRADPLSSTVQHALNRGPPGLEVLRLPVRRCRGRVPKDLEVVEAGGRVRVGQDVELEDAWLITDGAPRFTDGCLPERAYVLRLDADHAEDRVHAVSLRGHRPIVGKFPARLWHGDDTSPQALPR